MSRAAGATRRSGDPRKRAAAQAARPGLSRRTRLVVAVVLAILAVLVAVLLGVRGGHDEPDAQARARAESACELMTGAEEAGQVDTDARYAASMLLLDKAIIESARAAEADTAFVALDDAVQDAHQAAHRRDPDQYQAAMDSALAACEDVG